MTHCRTCGDDVQPGRSLLGYEKWQLKHHHNYDTTWVHAPA